MKLKITPKELEDRGLLGRFLKLRGWVPGGTHYHYISYNLADYVFGVIPDDYKHMLPSVLGYELTLNEEEMKELRLFPIRILDWDLFSKKKGFEPLSLVDEEDC